MQRRVRGTLTVGVGRLILSSSYYAFYSIAVRAVIHRLKSIPRGIRLGIFENKLGTTKKAKTCEAQNHVICLMTQKVWAEFNLIRGPSSYHLERTETAIIAI